MISGTRLPVNSIDMPLFQYVENQFFRWFFLKLKMPETERECSISDTTSSRRAKHNSPASQKPAGLLDKSITEFLQRH